MDNIEKEARELVDKMYRHQWREGNEEYRAAKRCALICVEEIINAISMFGYDDKFPSTYYQKLKEKIQSL